MKKGYLVVNSFIDSKKFNSLYELLLASFSSLGIDLELKTAISLGCEVDLKLKEKIDFVLFWDKDIYLAKRLENLGINLFNSPKAIELTDNKILMYQELSKSGIRIPKTFIAPKTFEGVGYSHLSFLDDVSSKIGYPLVIKEAYGSFGKQVYLASNREDAINIIKDIGYKDFLLQEYISSSKGKDLRINVVGRKAIVSILRENQFDFRSNISSGGKATLFNPRENFSDIAIKASEALGLNFSGVDVMFSKDGEPIICELNSNPQFESTLKASGINLADYIASYIKERI